MKIEKVIEKKVFYKCKLCGLKYDWKEDAEKCVIDHSCKHLNQEKTMNDGIIIKCSDCGKTIKEIDWDDVDNWELFKDDLWELLKKHRE